jgi:oligopeptide/dipeptide ABC transporter ATP-binding protein
MSSKPPVLEIDGLTVRFDTPSGTVQAVTDVSYSLGSGETLGIVGESGSGKSVHVLAMLRLLPQGTSRITGRGVRFFGEDLLRLDAPTLRSIRGNRIGVVFQDPMTSLNPVLTIGRQITETLEAHKSIGHAAAEAEAIRLLDMVKIPKAAQRIRQFPHEFSGGMRQRVMIAIALACKPQLLIADEATTALDVTTQAEIIDLVQELKRDLGMAVIWITHDLGVVARIADVIQVMYGGRVLERGPVDSVFYDPRNAYTLGLLQSAPSHIGSAASGRLTPIPGTPPDMRRPPAGDPFAPRNPWATPRCAVEMPPLRQVDNGTPGHLVAAWYDLPALRAHPQ